MDSAGLDSFLQVYRSLRGVQLQTFFIYWKTSKSQEETLDEFYSVALVCLVKTKRVFFHCLCSLSESMFASISNLFCFNIDKYVLTHMHVRSNTNMNALSGRSSNFSIKFPLIKTATREKGNRCKEETVRNTGY